MTRCNEFIVEGYAKVSRGGDSRVHGSHVPQYQSGMFRIPELNRWHVIVAGPQLTEELHKAPDDVLSFDAAVKDVRP
jgi:hypothetical protein